MSEPRRIAPRPIPTERPQNVLGDALRNLRMEVKQVNAGEEVISRGANVRGRAMFSGFQVSFGNDQLGWGPTRERAIAAFNNLMQNYVDKAREAGIPLGLQVGETDPREAARVALSRLDQATLFALLEEVLTTEQKEELGEGWFNIDRKGY